MLNTATKAKRVRKVKKKGVWQSIKAYSGLFVLSLIYFISKYGFSLENLKRIEFGDYILFGFILLGYVVQIVWSVLKAVVKAVYKKVISLFKSQDQTVEKILNSRVVSNQFSFLMKNRKLSKENVSEFLEQINKLLPKSQLRFYKGFKWENSAHEIYTKLKNTNLKSREHLVLLTALEQFQAQKEKQVETQFLLRIWLLQIM